MLAFISNILYNTFIIFPVKFWLQSVSQWDHQGIGDGPAVSPQRYCFWKPHSIVNHCDDVSVPCLGQTLSKGLVITSSGIRGVLCVVLFLSGTPDTACSP